MSGPYKPQRGFVLGKFMPPHNGHVYLCDFARQYCDRLTILVCSLDDDPIPGRQRFDWMCELFPRCDVQWCREDLPQEPADHPDFWTIWRDVVHRYGGQPDVVFASETYGAQLAQEVGARFVPVDPARGAVPTSGTAVRADPFANWSHIPPPVRPWFVKRACLFGPESTGKSTLSARLAEHFKTTFVPEYGRTHTETFGVDVTEDDLANIVLGHEAASQAARRQANRVLIEDTDPVLTAVWADMLLDRRPLWLDERRNPADLYLLCDIDAPWVDDSTRYFRDEATRRFFMDRCRTELERRGLPYVTLSGDWDTRLATAIDAIEGAFGL